MFIKSTNIASAIMARGELDINRLAKAGRKLLKKHKWVKHLPTGLKIGLSPHKSTKFH